MSKSMATKRKGADGLPDPPAKKNKVASTSEKKPSKKSRVAASTASAEPDIATSNELPKIKKIRKTAADFLSDDDDTAASAVKKSKAVEKHAEDKSAPSVNETKPAKISKKKTKEAPEPVPGKLKGSKKSTSTNFDDLAASRQLRSENGEPVTPAAPTVLAAKKAKKADQSKIEKAEAENSKLAKTKPVDPEKARRAELIALGRNPDQLTPEEAAEVNARRDAKFKALDDLRLKQTTKKKGMKSKKVVDQAEEVENEASLADDAPSEEDAELLKGFDSDTPDDVQDGELDIRETPPISDPTGKVEKQLREAKNKVGPDDEPGAIYIGHIPHGFFEVQMRAFFSQFGEITRIRLSRNRRTGASKHFAFVEFASSEVAKIAAKTMDGYLMFGHILKSKFAPADSLHPDVWKGANKKFHKIPHAKLEGQKLAEPKSAEEWDKKAKKEEAKRKRKAEAVKLLLGYDSPEASIAAAKKAKKEKKAA